MTKHVAVVGAQFGDEGKGLTTDYLCHKMMNELGTTNGLVVRYNSGAQAGHTVVTPEGWRHVHSHIGSGWNLEIPTYLSKHFVCNPFILLKEQQMGHQRLHVKADPRCLVTTHYDMFFNQVLEDARSQRHGSCGLGFNETIQRSRFVYFNLGDIENNPKLDSIMEMIHQYYIKVRIPQAAANDGINPKNLEKFYLRKVSQYSNVVMIHALRDLPKMLYLTTEMPTTDFVVFEGAQGLRLDQNYGEFPYVTRSNTGLQNVKQILNEFDRGILDEAVYVTRAYTTRHGNGYLPFERKWGHLFNGFDDKTNVTNGYQGEFRYAPSYPQEIVELAEHDYWKHVDHNTKFSFMITCLDQLPEEIPMMYFSRITEDEDLIYLKRDDFFRQFPFARYASFGETREDVVSL